MLKHPSQEAKGKESEMRQESTTGPGKKEAVGQNLGSAPDLKQAKKKSGRLAHSYYRFNSQ